MRQHIHLARVLRNKKRVMKASWRMRSCSVWILRFMEMLPGSSTTGYPSRAISERLRSLCGILLRSLHSIMGKRGLANWPTTSISLPQVVHARTVTEESFQRICGREWSGKHSRKYPMLCVPDCEGKEGRLMVRPVNVLGRMGSEYGEEKRNKGLVKFRLRLWPEETKELGLSLGCCSVGLLGQTNSLTRPG